MGQEIFYCFNCNSPMQLDLKYCHNCMRDHSFPNIPDFWRRNRIRWTPKRIEKELKRDLLRVAKDHERVESEVDTGIKNWMNSWEEKIRKSKQKRLATGVNDNG